MTLEAIKHIDEDIPGFWQELQKTMERKKISRPKVVIHGGYGKNNMGDDALFHAIYTRVMKAFPAAEVTAVCHGPENLKNGIPISVHAILKALQPSKPSWAAIYIS